MNKSRKIKELESGVSEIFVVNDKELRPYIELLNFLPENISQKNLGKLLGFLEIKDDSEDSAYIVNFISSVIKKEYFINPKRSAINSLEAALNKANLALSEVAKHGNVNWLGKFDASICVIDKDEIHFSVSGNAKILLLRNNELIDISAGLAPEGEDPYPMKTFVNVSSGKLEKNDKILVTTEDIFHIFSMNEIKKSADHFSKEKFFQFLKTALVNELEIAGTFVIDVSEKVLVEPKKESKEDIDTEEINAFSEKTFRESVYAKKLSATSDKEESLDINKEKEKSEKEKSEYTDKKTGHIYLKDGYQIDLEENQIVKTIKFRLREKRDDILSWMKNKPKKYFKKKLLELTEVINKFFSSLFLETKRKLFTKKIATKNNTSPENSSIDSKPRTIAILTSENKKSYILYSKKFFTFLSKIFSIKNLKNILPSFSKIKKQLFEMNLQQKIYTLLLVLAIILVPFLALKNKNKTAYVVEDSLPEKENTILLPTNNTKAVEIKNLLEIGFLENIKKIVTVNNKIFVVSKSGISEIINDEIKESYQMPINIEEIKGITTMEDLGLILIVDQYYRAYSFNVISQKFQENNITFPEGLAISHLATYLTYLYVIDANNNQIYRYPRAEGGFGEKTDWIKEDFDFENISDIAIDGNIYIAKGGSIYKLFEGKNQNLSTENSEPSINFEKVFTNEDVQFIYTLDSQNSRIIKLDKEGVIEKEYYHEKIKEIHKFTIDIEKERIYLSSDNMLFYFQLGQQ